METFPVNVLYYELRLRSPFGGIPRNWKLRGPAIKASATPDVVPPSGGSLEIGNTPLVQEGEGGERLKVPPSGGSLEIGNSR